MRQERDTRLVRRIAVLDTAGTRHTVVEWGDFLRVQSLDGQWSEWMRSGGRLRIGDEPVNPTDDPQVFELAATGERLTAVAPRQ